MGSKFIYCTVLKVEERVIRKGVTLFEVASGPYMQRTSKKRTRKEDGTANLLYG